MITWLVYVLIAGVHGLSTPRVSALTVTALNAISLIIIIIGIMHVGRTVPSTIQWFVLEKSNLWN
jgi:hypothetical protein